MIVWPIDVTQNKYTKWYEQLVNKAKNRTLSGDVYTETHHIVPHCISQDNSKDNLVVLTAREHYIAHLLLWRMGMPSKWHNKMMMALWVMTNGSGNGNQKMKRSKLKLHSSKLYETFIEERRRISGKQAAERWKDPKYRNNIVNQLQDRWNDPEYKERMSQVHKERMSTPEARKASSENSQTMWNNRSEQERNELLDKTLRKVTADRKGKTYEEIYTPEQIERMHKARENRVLSDDAKERMKQGQLNASKCPMPDHVKIQVGNRFRGRTDLNGENNGMFGRKHSEESKAKMRAALAGRKQTAEQIEKRRQTNKENAKTCVHCGKTYARHNYSRWHGDNCKLKP